MVDGNPNTFWHTKFNVKTDDKSYTIELNDNKKYPGLSIYQQMLMVEYLD